MLFVSYNMLKFIFAFLLLPSILLGQVINDDCSLLISLGTLPFCSNEIYNNLNASSFDIGFDNEPSCFVDNPPKNDIWFSFKINPNIVDYDFNIQGNDLSSELQPISNIQVAIYRGFCAENSLALRNCFVGNEGENNIQFSLNNTTPNETLYLRISNYGGNINNGSFQICIEESENVFLIDQQASSDCKGVLYDSGGETDNYSNSETHEFTICPSAPHQCIQFDLEYYNIEGGTDVSGDKLIFYNGANTNAEVIGVIGEDRSFDSSFGGGGICYTVFADQCLTIQFTSDASITYEGFKGKWQCTTTPCKSESSLQVNENAGSMDILEAISTPLTQIAIDTIICSDVAIGTFTTTNNSNLGIEKGIVLTTGNVINAIGPNTLDDRGFNNGFPGDLDIDVLSQESEFIESFDACVIELDVFTITNELTFDYIFASEEYPEFVNTDFNDNFSLLISGPGIIGNPNINNQKNMAILPGQNVPVEINSINQKENWEFFRNNSFGTEIEYDGLTSDQLGTKKSLTASEKVIPCNTYHLKFVIADRGDLDYDSGVFIGEISSGLPEFQTSFFADIDFLVEGCSGNHNSINIVASSVPQNNVEYKIEVSGTANRNIDYTTDLPNIITFSETTLSQEYTISPIVDNIIEDNEEIIIKITSESPCGSFEVDELIIPIKDKVELELQDSIIVCKDASIDVQVTGASIYSWSPIQNIEDPFTDVISVNGDEDRWYIVQGSLSEFEVESCYDKDSIYVKVVEPNIEIQALSSTNVCIQDSIPLTITTLYPSDLFFWKAEKGTFSHEDQITTTYIPDRGGEDISVIAQQEVGGCVVRDTLQVQVDDFHYNILPANDTICQGEVLNVGNPDPYFSSTFMWSPEEGVSNPSSSRADLSPSETTLYIQSSQSPRNYCSRMDSILIQVIENNVDINEISNTNLCLDESVQLSYSFISAEANPNFEWFFQNENLFSNQSNISFAPQSSGFIKLAMENSICKATDSIFLQVDSIPSELELSILPNKDIYCKGENIAIISDMIDPIFYPNINFQWEDPTSSIQTDNAVQNIGYIADSTTTLYRYLENGACRDTQSISINVDSTRIDFQVLPDSSATFGDIVNIEANTPNSSYPITNYQWFVNNGVIQNGLNSKIDFTFDEENSIVLLCAENSIGCIIKDSIIIGTNEIEIFFPNVVIPNSEIEEDTYFTYVLKRGDINIDVASLSDIEFKIFNRWGQTIFECYNIECMTTGWDGLISGSLAPPEIYTYYFDAIAPNGEQISKKGTFNLLR